MPNLAPLQKLLQICFLDQIATQLSVLFLLGSQNFGSNVLLKRCSFQSFIHRNTMTMFTRAMSHYHGGCVKMFVFHCCQLNKSQLLFVTVQSAHPPPTGDHFMIFSLVPNNTFLFIPRLDCNMKTHV